MPSTTWLTRRRQEAYRVVPTLHTATSERARPRPRPRPRHALVNGLADALTALRLTDEEAQDTQEVMRPVM